MRIAVVGDYNPDFFTHPATTEALLEAGKGAGLDVQPEWIATDSFRPEDAPERLHAYDGIFLAPGSPYRSMPSALAAVRFARERGRPFVAT